VIDNQCLKEEIEQLRLRKQKLVLEAEINRLDPSASLKEQVAQQHKRIEELSQKLGSGIQTQRKGFLGTVALGVKRTFSAKSLGEIAKSLDRHFKDQYGSAKTKKKDGNA
jgi:predicted site-specific integrase-resolvase